MPGSHWFWLIWPVLVDRKQGFKLGTVWYCLVLFALTNAC